MRTHVVEHDPVWEPAQLRINAEGDTAPGFVCVHQMENGNGPCGGNVFSLDQAVGRHACVVRAPRPWYLYLAAFAVLLAGVGVVMALRHQPISWFFTGTGIALAAWSLIWSERVIKRGKAKRNER